MGRVRQQPEGEDDDRLTRGRLQYVEQASREWTQTTDIVARFLVTGESS